ncbi:MAG: hypothetical protein HZB22_04125 [Deltaproteobacteria bacterium]|nr:hypothetical protein [Deltaproteobacteria bacterium]
MNESRRFDLLSDLARLIKKHGIDAFAELANYLSHPEAIEHLITIIEGTFKAGQSASIDKDRGAQGAGRGTGVKRLIDDLEKSDPQKAEIISAFYHTLLAKNALPSIKEMRDFSIDTGLKPVHAKSRDKAIFPLLKDIAARPLNEVKDIIGRISLRGIGDDRTLEGWAKVILNKEHRQR